MILGISKTLEREFIIHSIQYCQLSKGLKHQQKIYIVSDGCDINYLSAGANSSLVGDVIHIDHGNVLQHYKPNCVSQEL